MLDGETVEMVKVLWRNRSLDEATWEPKDVFKAQHPHLFDPGDVDSEPELPPPPPLDQTVPARAARAHHPPELIGVAVLLDVRARPLEDVTCFILIRRRFGTLLEGFGLSFHKAIIAAAGRGNDTLFTCQWT
ncbi:hypothetical protein V6N12_001184 [Hibiscus sabdariffa]|uniref:Chromo domain-containing protein n=1 Tax=Hibiscus sabdariffa TaxID=183260 RepID=A0ABR2C6H2_9ROSI